MKLVTAKHGHQHLIGFLIRQGPSSVLANVITIIKTDNTDNCRKILSSTDFILFINKTLTISIDANNDIWMHTNIRNRKASAFIQIQICIQKYKYSYTYKYTTDHCDEHPVGSPGTSLLRKPFAHRPDTSFISFMYIFLYSYFLYSYFYVSIFISYFVIFVFFLYLYFYVYIFIFIFFYIYIFTWWW